MFLWLAANLKQGVIYFIKQALPPNKSAGSVCKNSISFFGKNSLNVPNVKLFSKTNHRFGFFMPFWWYLTPCTLHIKGIKNLNGLNDLNSLNNLIGLNDLSRFLKLKILRIIILYSESRKKSGQTFVYILLDFALHWHFMFIW